MRRFAILAVMAFVSATAGAQPASDGATTQRTFNVGGFRQVVLEGSMGVVVEVGPKTLVQAEGDPHLLEQVEVRVDGDRLVVSQARGSWLRRSNGRVIVHVITPRVEGAFVSGSGSMRVAQAVGDRFTGAVDSSGSLAIQEIRGGRSDLSTSGSGSLNVTSMNVKDTRLNVSGSGSLRASGQTESVHIESDASGSVSASTLIARRATIRSSGSGAVRAQASDTAEVTSSGSGGVIVSGGARCRVQSSGSGGVRCG
jgi:hypothetical protein